MSTTPATRRELLWRITAGAGGGAAAALAYWGGQPAYDYVRKNIGWFSDENPDHITRWRRLFGHYPPREGGRIEAVAGIAHRNISSDRSFRSSSSKLVSDAYSRGFPDPLVYRNPRNRVIADPASTLLCVGSRKSNAIVREYLGPLNSHERADVTLLPSNGAQWSGEARWSLVSLSRDTRPAYVQNGIAWPADGITGIVDHHKKLLYQSEEKPFTRPLGKYERVPVVVGGHPVVVHERDYLLVHVLPRLDTRQPGRVILVEGLHRPGTLAARRLFSTTDMAFLKSIDERTGRSSYYQALFEVRCGHTAAGEMFDESISLIDAEPVLIQG